MAVIPFERRICRRFAVPGASVTYQIRRFVLGETDASGEARPVLALSKGGLGFLTNSQLAPGQKLSMRLAFKDNEESIPLEGAVIYCVPHAGISYRYHAGVVFAPFAPGKGYNSIEALQKLRRLEEVYATP